MDTGYEATLWVNLSIEEVAKVLGGAVLDQEMPQKLGVGRLHVCNGALPKGATEIPASLPEEMQVQLDTTGVYVERFGDRSLHLRVYLSAMLASVTAGQIVIQDADMIGRGPYVKNIDRLIINIGSGPETSGTQGR